MRRFVLISGVLTLAVFIGTTTLVAGDNAAAPAAVPTFTKDIAPVLYNSCVSCHRPGEIAPMSLISYEDTRPWARAIKEKVKSREMPPWGADPHNSVKMKNDRSLTDEQIAMITAWADGGAPKGNDTDLPKLPSFASGWSANSEPDFIFEMPVEYTIPAEGEVPYLYFYIKIPFTEDKFVDQLELRPSNMAIVHHSGAYVVDIPEGVELRDGRAYGPDGKELEPEGLRKLAKPNTSVFDEPLAGSSKLISYVPGRGAEHHPPGFAKRIPAGKYIYFVQHYNPIGKEASDRTRLGVWFAKTPTTHEVLNLQAGDPVPSGGSSRGRGLYFAQGKEVVYTADDTTGRRGATPTIPAYEEAFKMVGTTPVTEPITLYALTPHMHLRGKSMKWVVTWPDGKETTVLDVPKYDFNWQIDYELAEPMKIPAGSKITAIAYYDNSLKNKWNPAPEKEVYWSEQSWDEMFQPTTQFSVDSQDLTKKAKTTTQQQQQQQQR
jgi:hypothetical protein